MIFKKYTTITVIVLSSIFSFSCSTTETIPKYSPNYPQHVSYDTITAKKFDTGKMWTFEDAPLDYFEQTYNFRPNQNWLDEARLSTLKFANWCTASFVSEDGLIMTNHHCVDFILDRFQEEDENLKNNGFYAPSLSDERKVPDLFVDQLVYIEDVTDEVIKAFNSGATDEEKNEKKVEKISELENYYKEETGLECSITPLYNGGKFSLYGYKRYNDVRAVYVNESGAAMWGGDPDNFTYPRYDADFAFLRVYDDDGNPFKSEHYFKFSDEFPNIDEPLFIIGNPGTTLRLKTIAQLEYYRDFTFRSNAFRYQEIIKNYKELINELPERSDEFTDKLVFEGNSAKVFEGMYETLIDPGFIARKKDFEHKFKSAVMNNPELSEKYGKVWESLETTRNELRSIAPERTAYRLSNTAPIYFEIAENLIQLAEQLKLPEEERMPNYFKEKLDSTIAGIFPETIDHPVENKNLRLQCDFITYILGGNNEIVKNFTGGYTGKKAAEYIKKNSIILTKEGVFELAGKGSDAILNSNDPFIRFILSTQDKLNTLDAQALEIQNTESYFEDLLGQALYAVYGTSIPPDATFTLRITDGIMKPFQYNGTIAPVFTTFYGLYDRFYGQGQKYPWDLPERWQKPAEGFNLSTPYNFITTHDITGGSSGSPVITKNMRLVGVAFDGNIESIAGAFIFDPTINRNVAVSSKAMLQILDYVTNARRISNELKAGKIREEIKVSEEVEVE